jgi:hypothetical protein
MEFGATRFAVACRQDFTVMAPRTASRCTVRLRDSRRAVSPARERRLEPAKPWRRPLADQRTRPLRRYPCFVTDKHWAVVQDLQRRHNRRLALAASYEIWHRQRSAFDARRR